MRFYLTSAAVALIAIAAPAHAVDTTASSDADAMGASLAGAGFNLVSTSLTTNTGNGFFTNGLAGTGIAQGVVLTTGTLGCIGSSNTTGSCSGGGNNSSLTLNFTLDSDSLFFNYVFGSEEYNEFVGSNFNDGFNLLLNGPGFANVNLAQIPGGGGPVTINNVNLGSNSAFYRNNSPGPYPIELDGLTTVLTASASGLMVGSQYSLTFNIFDTGDSGYDSAVFIQGGTIGTVPVPPGAVPEPATWAMMIGGFGLAGAAMRRRRRIVHAIA